MLTLSLLAAGLGNLQRFPYLMGEHGGGAFFVSYLIALCVLSVPVLIAEVAIGSLGRGSPGWRYTGLPASATWIPAGATWVWRKRRWDWSSLPWRF